jgi:hypothetical protein
MLHWLNHFCYIESAIFITMTYSFFRFCQLFLRFYCMLQWLSQFCYSVAVICCILSIIFESSFVRYSASDSTILLQWLSHFEIPSVIFLWFRQSFFRFHCALQWLSHFTTVIQSFFYISLAIFRFHHALQRLSHFQYSNSVICLNLVTHFWDFVAHYSDLAIFAIMTQPFLKFCHALQWLSHYSYNDSVIF